MDKLGLLATIAIIIQGFIVFGNGAKFVSTPPRIQVTGNLNGRYLGTNGGNPDDDANKDAKNVSLTIQEGGNTYLVSSRVGQLTLDCNASYPVTWNLMDSKINSEMFPFIYVRTKRFASDLFDSAAYNYSAQMVLEGPSSPHKFTGNYSCQNTATRDVQSNVFIYWEGVGYETLVHSKEMITTYVEKDGRVMLPCGISSPHSTIPKLKKRDKKNKLFTEMKLNKSISYNPASGFTLSLPNPAGTYKCIVNEEREDFVTITVKNATAKTVRKANATLTFDSEANEVECCSGGKKAPNIFLFYCDHAVTCQYREHIVQPYHYIFSRTKKNGSCARKSARLFHTALIRCVGDGIDEYKEMITPIRTGYNSWGLINKTMKVKMYFSWEQIEPQEMLALDVHPSYHNGHPDTNLYNQQRVDVECDTSHYYFSEGIYWAIRYKNKSLIPVTEQVDGVPNGLPSHRELVRSNYLSYTLDLSMEALLCFAPVWNSTVWVMKNKFLFVNQTVKPTMLLNNSLEYTWNTNEKSKELSCEAKGLPEPSFLWKQENTPIGNHLNYNITITVTRNNNTKGIVTTKSILRILTVGTSTRGKFICTASNYGGTVERSFNVIVLENTSFTSATILTISCLVIVVLVIMIIVVLRVMKIHQKAIQHLTSVHFKDPTTIQQAVSTDVTNTTCDNGKMTNQLIH